MLDSPRPAGWLASAAIVAATVVFFAIPVLSDSTSIHWDAADVQYPVQKYFAARLHDLPFWTPYVYSGYPLLANPVVGAWYPPNWPFFLAGITPKAVQVELLLHALLAGLGMYLLLAKGVTHRSAAVLGAFAYAFSGFFVSYAGDPSVFAGASWFPWLVLSVDSAVNGNALRGCALGALAGGTMLLSGFPQMAAFGFLGVVIYTMAGAGGAPYQRRALVLGATIAGSLLVASIQLLPYIQLAMLSSDRHVFAGADGSFPLRPLLTILLPDAVGSISAIDRGRIVDHYFYSGILVLPLAAVGAAKTQMRRAPLILLGVSIWYFIGPWGGLYWLGRAVPGLQGSGPAVLGRFLPAFALAVLAAAGTDWIILPWKRGAVLGAICAALLFADVWYWNSFRNPLFYTRQSFQDLYGRPEEYGRYRLAGPQLTLYRFDSPFIPRGMGPLLFPLDLKMETTFGFLGLVPDSYYDYARAMRHNTRLRDGLNVNRYADAATRDIESSQTALPRAYFPKSVEIVRSEDESRKALAALDPAAKSLVLRPPVNVIQDPEATAMVGSWDEQSYRIHYRTGQGPALLKLAVAWFPGWEARVDGRPVPVVRVDHALIGAIVPPGERDVVFRFRSTYFATGAIVSCVALALALLLIIRERLLPHGRAAALERRTIARG